MATARRIFVLIAHNHDKLWTHISFGIFQEQHYRTLMRENLHDSVYGVGESLSEKIIISLEPLSKLSWGQG